jgi:hypothetical protein
MISPAFRQKLGKLLESAHNLVKMLMERGFSLSRFGLMVNRLGKVVTANSDLILHAWDSGKKTLLQTEV